MELSSPLGVVAIEKGAFGSGLAKVTNFTFYLYRANHDATARRLLIFALSGVQDNTGYSVKIELISRAGRA